MKIIKSLLSLCIFLFLACPVLADEVDDLIQKGQAAVEKGKDGEAEKYFSEAVAKNPRNASARFELSIYWMNRALSTEDRDLLLKAMAESEVALEINPSFGEAEDNLAYCYFILRDYEKSNEHFEKARRLGIRNDFLMERLTLLRQKIREKTQPPPASQEPLLPKTQPPVLSDDETGGGLAS